MARVTYKVEAKSFKLAARKIKGKISYICKYINVERLVENENVYSVTAYLKRPQNDIALKQLYAAKMNGDFVAL